MIRGMSRRVVPRGQTVQFTESTASYTIPVGVRKFKVFVVGGGASGRQGSSDSSSYTSEAGSGGGSGYTATQEVEIDKPITVAITVGSGGERTSGYGRQNAGNASSVVGDGVNVTANGGTTDRPNHADYNHDTQTTTSVSSATDPAVGSNGGSGGGCGKYKHAYSVHSAVGGNADGAGGTVAYSIYFSSATGADHTRTYYNGNGQGTTTRAFGELTETLFATGGNGVGSTDATANTGNGGDGADFGGVGCAGAMGIVLIKWNNGGR